MGRPKEKKDGLAFFFFFFYYDTNTEMRHEMIRLISALNFGSSSP